MGLKVEHVCKSFGSKKVVNDINFELNKPGIFGLLGTNGAGKTTTIRMILGIIFKDSGKITWNDKQVDRKKVKFGYLPEERGVYPKTKIRDQLMYFANLRGMSNKDATKAMNKWAEVLKVEEYLDMDADKLSKGNQQKIQFMMAIIHDPDLIILDEPFSGLDPVNTDIIKKVIIDLVNKGKYIIMSAHEMHTIEEFCTDILILNKGKTVLQGNLKDIRNSYKANRVVIETSTDIHDLIDKNKLIIEKEVNGKYYIKLDDEDKAHKLLKNIIDSKININHFEIMHPSLNDIFIEKVGR